jgi:hypothetical protein
VIFVNRIYKDFCVRAVSAWSPSFSLVRAGRMGARRGASRRHVKGAGNSAAARFELIELLQA